ncbi:MAG: acetolactate synthase small subunit [Nitrososphaerota archaeon]|jgi:acetolactate synthase-1/3 small subunit|uniref:acetolactate synthase small subunit n=1 Tax=Candidatus Bathycorpusculum sp. TaxID=2994959 RepID=UPI00282A23D1|nr:acetolactate synthase small subunit [Candidatus Termiticorpusculum sp.]MCL2257497.1 acetolactate synthase small subunit [Candidatus Termiticorpusculum sp.]MCL2292368.1 acetolactate synthase small subunit [Candidatus Termiticorpusculum sp.]MDR0460761.1 acetolactate synthase small subunit [Nitrososphaerota archaeon]
MESGKTKIISVLVENKPGVLHSIANLFRRRNFNIESITVGATQQQDIARMTITVNADEKTLDQVVKQVAKQIDVLKVEELESGNFVMREIALIKVEVTDSKTRSDVINFVKVFRSRIIDISPDSLTVEITGGPDKINAFLNLMKTFGVLELARTGITALARGAKSIKIDD